MLRRLSLAALLSCLVCGSLPQAQAADAACKPILDADKARAAATSWHSKKAMGETSMEMIRLGDDIYANLGGSGWKKMPPGMVKNIAKASDGLDVSECKKLGTENVAGVATTIYSFKTAIPGQATFSGKVWIGDKDGLPYREAGDKYDGTTTYTGVTAPAVK